MTHLKNTKQKNLASVQDSSCLCLALFPPSSKGVCQPAVILHHDHIEVTVTGQTASTTERLELSLTPTYHVLAV